jgi:hypothetical protein
VTTSRARAARRTHEARHAQLALARRGLHQAAIRARDLGLSAASFEDRALDDELLSNVYGDRNLLLRELEAVLNVVWSSSRAP